MTNFITIFPDEYVTFPNEVRSIRVNDSIYIELIKDCIANKKHFGTVWHSEGKKEFGTSVEILETSDLNSENITVTIKGISVFKILENVNEIPDKPYSGAIVNYPENTFLKISPDLEMLIIKEVFERFKEVKDAENVDFSLTSYSLALQTGMKEPQKYELLQLMNEVLRMEYIRRFLEIKNDPEDNNLKLLLHNFDLN